MNRRILVADDSSTIQKVIKIAFARYAVEIVEAGSYIEALAAVGRMTPDALIIDASLPGARGPQDFAKLSADSSGAPLLLLVGTYEAVDEEAFRVAGFQNFLKKPFESGDIVQVMTRLLGGELGPARAPRHAFADDPLTARTDPTGMPDGGPIVPPLPGSRDRTQHSTVIHPGGLSGVPGPRVAVPPGAALGEPEPLIESLGGPLASPRFDALEDLGGDPSAVPPPPPQLDRERKGRRAFEEPPPGAFSLGDEDAPAPPPPPRGRGSSPGLAAAMDDDGPTARSVAGSGSNPRLTAAGRGSERIELSLEDGDGFVPPSVVRDLPRGGERPAPGRRPAGGAARGGEPEVLAALEQELPALVRQAVEDYCERHFKSLAREVIASELRRLADEKARHLVDN